MTIQEILNYAFITIGDFTLNLYNLIAAAIIIILARIVMFVVSRVLRRIFHKQQVDTGRRYAVKQFAKYIIYTVAALLTLQALGINLSLVWAGSAALLVGIGLGLQEVFLNLTSGIILLIEGTVEVGDVLDIDGLVGRVSKIGIRTSKIETRDGISIVVPNSKLVTDKVTNWSHNEQPTRFQIYVGVAYSSDVDLVTDLLLASANQHKDVLKTPPPRVQFNDFGNSSLDFILHFHSLEFWRIEMVKSEIRYAITKNFRVHDIEIPFPQQDLWLRNPEVLK